MLVELFDLSTWVLLIASAAFIYIYLTSTKTYKNLPPGPTGLPIVGNLPFFMKTPMLHVKLAEMAKEYGPVMRFRLGSTNVIILSGYDVMKEAIVEKADYFSDRPTWLTTLKDLDREAGIIFNVHWRDRRRFALSSMRDFGLGKKSLDERMREEAGFLVKEIDRTEGKPRDLTQLLPFVTGNIICSIIFGDRFPYGDKDFTNLLQSLNNIARGPGIFCLQNFFPFLKFLSTSGFKVVRDETQVIMAMAKKRQQEHEEDFDPENIRDLTDLFIKEIREGNSKFDDKDLVGCLVDLFAAGTETTSTTLSWALLYLIHNPDIQERCRQEIITEVGSDLIPQYNDIKKLPYVNAVLNEVQRLGNIVAFSVPHASNADVELAGYTIPGGSIILPNMYTALRDEKYLKNPDVFDPDRWLDSEGKIKNIPGFIPFSIGKRVCLGEQLAKKELFIFFTSMVQNFRFTMEDEKNPPSLKGVDGPIHGPGNYNLRALRV